MPIIIPKIASADAKISTIKILTKRDASCASPRAQELPAMPTETLMGDREVTPNQLFTHTVQTYPLTKLVTPTVMPAPNTA